MHSNLLLVEHFCLWIIKKKNRILAKGAVSTSERIYAYIDKTCSGQTYIGFKGMSRNFHLYIVYTEILFLMEHFHPRYIETMAGVNIYRLPDDDLELPMVYRLYTKICFWLNTFACGKCSKKSINTDLAFHITHFAAVDFIHESQDLHFHIV